MKVKKYVLDTSVIVEYIDEESPYRDNLERLFDDIDNGSLKAYVSTMTLSEVLYVASRIYRNAGMAEPNKEARIYVEWLVNKPGIEVVEISKEIGILAGEIRKKVRISLVDCTVLAVAKIMNARPLFLKKEKEMESFIDTLLSEYEIEFLVE